MHFMWEVYFSSNYNFIFNRKVASNAFLAAMALRFYTTLLRTIIKELRSLRVKWNI